MGTDQTGTCINGSTFEGRPATSSFEPVTAPRMAPPATQSCGVLSDGSLIAWGKSETVQIDNSVVVWRCGFKSRYYRFLTIAVRGGAGTRGVHLAEIELYAVGQKLTVIESLNPGGSNPPGFSAAKAGRVF